MLAFLVLFYCDHDFDFSFYQHGYDSDYGLNLSHYSSLFSCFSPVVAFFLRILIGTFFCFVLQHFNLYFQFRGTFTIIPGSSSSSISISLSIPIPISLSLPSCFWSNMVMFTWRTYFTIFLYDWALMIHHMWEKMKVKITK